MLSFLGQSLTDPQSGDDGGLDLFAGTPGGLALPERWPSSPMPASVVPGDFDGDGRTDLAVAGAAAGTLSVYWNEGGE